MSLPIESVIFPSGRTLTSPLTSGARHTVTISTSSAPMM
jgi:hypothetical protein